MADLGNEIAKSVLPREQLEFSLGFLPLEQPMIDHGRFSDPLGSITLDPDSVPRNNRRPGSVIVRARWWVLGKEQFHSLAENGCFFAVLLPLVKPVGCFGFVLAQLVRNSANLVDS